MKRILVLCTANSCRSQMAEAVLRALSNGQIDVHSAGTDPGQEVHPLAVRVMKEIGLSMHGHYPKSVETFLHQPFDYVLTVCGEAEERCPHFSGAVRHRLHIPFEDPARATGTEEECLQIFRRVRDQIIARMFALYHSRLKP